MKSLKFAVIQTGYAVFGAGHTRQQAIDDARNWLEDENGVQGGMSVSDVEELISVRPNVGDFTILSADDPDFDSYMKNQGGFVQRNGEWYNT